MDATSEPPKESKRPLARRWILEGLVLVGFVVAISSWQTRHLVGSGSQAPLFELTALDGSRVSLTSVRGKRTLVHFWATWCGVCRQELSALNAVQDGLSPDEALLTVVADSDDVEAVRRFVGEHGLRYPVLLATPEVLRDYRVDAFPTNYYVDPAGKVASRTIGMSTRWSFRARLALSR